MKTAGLTALVAVYWLLHQDVWNWRSAGPFAFGFLPVGLWYHALYTLGIPALMWLLVSYAWPHDLEKEVEGEKRG
ncbi:MAG: hypothetical protein HYZ37_01790 [Candidatus Solibacter usitatus]|nr:hypothetical protein [Candidatus Solibacter usitatus]